MNLHAPNRTLAGTPPAHRLRRGRGAASHQRASVLIIVLWIAFGLVCITLYFANSMSFELRASDNRVEALAADQAIAGAARYASYVLTTYNTNGSVPEPLAYAREGVLLGEARFWFVGRRDRTDRLVSSLNQPFFNLVDEASKLNLNTAPASLLELLPRMTPELAAAIVDWRDADSTITAGGAESETYGRLRPPYVCKNANFETVEELRLVYGATMDILVGEDANRNGVLDANEYDEDRNNEADPGVLEYVTIYSREPNTRSDGSARINISTSSQAQLSPLLRTNFGAARAAEILRNLQSATSRSPLEFYVRSGMTAEEFGKIAGDISASAGAYITGRVNVATASKAVLACLPGIGEERAPQLVGFRESNPTRLTSLAWVIEAVGLQGNAARQFAVQLGDRITTQSYQFTADIAAVGPHGRGYRRVRFVFDTCEGTPRILYRQDLSHLGWALGREARRTWLMAKESR